MPVGVTLWACRRLRWAIAFASATANERFSVCTAFWLSDCVVGVVDPAIVVAVVPGRVGSVADPAMVVVVTPVDAVVEVVSTKTTVGEPETVAALRAAEVVEPARSACGAGRRKVAGFWTTTFFLILMVGGL